MRNSLSDDPDWRPAINLTVARRRREISAAETLQEDATIVAEHPTHTPLPITNMERAKRFYAERLDLFPETELPDERDGVFYRCGGAVSYGLPPPPTTASSG